MLPFGHYLTVCFFSRGSLTVLYVEWITTDRYLVVMAGYYGVVYQLDG